MYYPSTSSSNPPAPTPTLLITDPNLNMPATTIVEFQTLEREINEDFSKECLFVNELRETDAATLEKYIRKCLRKIITDEAARRFSWRGNIKNLPVSNFTVLKILKHEAIQKFPNSPSSNVEPIMRKWFRYAKDRFNKRHRYFNTYRSPKLSTVV